MNVLFTATPGRDSHWHEVLRSFSWSGIDIPRHRRREWNCAHLLDDLATQQISTASVSKGNGCNGNALLPAGGNHLGFELGAVSRAPATGLVSIFARVYVST
jgi:hypothetical protein